MKMTMKKLLVTLAFTVLATVIFCFSASAETYGDYEYSYDEYSEGYIINNYTGKSTNLKLPSEINGKKIIGLDIIDNSTVKYITVPGSYKYMRLLSGWKNLVKITVSSKNPEYSSDENGFLYDKEKMELIFIPPKTTVKTYNMPASVKYLDGYMLYKCVNLQKIVVPAANQDYSSDKNGALYNKDKTELISLPPNSTVTGFVVPHSVIGIESSAFSNCKNLKSVTLSDNLGEYFYLNLDNCVSLEKFVATSKSKNFSTDKNGVLFNKDKTTLVRYPTGRKATSYTTPKGVKSIGTVAFLNANNLKKVTVTAGVKDIHMSAFYTMSALETVTLPEGVEYLGSACFANCVKLKSINLPSTLTGVGCCVFSECESLETINIPKSANYVAYCAFNGCTKLTKFTVDKGSVDFSTDKNGVLYNKDKTTLVKYPSGIKSTIYKVPQGCKMIDMGAFSDCPYLKYVTLPESMEEPYGFSNCEKLEKVTVNAKNKNLCSDKNGIMYDKEKTRIRLYPQNCKLTAYAIPETVTELYHISANNLQAVFIPLSVKEVSYDPFGECKNLKTVYYPGTEEQWNSIDFSSEDKITGVKIVYNHKHTYKTVITQKATLTKNGSKVSRCACGKEKGSEATIYAPKTFKLSTYTYTYAGKVRTPVVTVKDSKGNTLKKDTDYTVKYASGRKLPGKYTVTITFKGKYSGKKTLTFKINPAATKITKAASTKKGVANLTWSNVTGESGYEIYFSTKKDSGFKKLGTYKVNVTTASKSKLTSGKTYYFKVRAYKSTSSGNLYSTFSAAKAVKIK